MIRGGKSGPALIPGKPDQSLIVQMIGSGKMPPKKRLFEVGVTPVSDSDLKKLRQWILQGAPEEDIQPDVAGTEPDPLVSDRDRQFWAFQPPRQVFAAAGETWGNRWRIRSTPLYCKGWKPGGCRSQPKPIG